MSSETVDSLKATIQELEQRIVNLESKLINKATGSDAMRMILIGPPGAGKFFRFLLSHSFFSFRYDIVNVVSRTALQERKC